MPETSRVVAYYANTPTALASAADKSAGRYVAVDPIDDAAADFYAHHGFVANSDGNRMIRAISSARQILGATD